MKQQQQLLLHPKTLRLREIDQTRPREKTIPPSISVSGKDNVSPSMRSEILYKESKVPLEIKRGCSCMLHQPEMNTQL